MVHGDANVYLQPNKGSEAQRPQLEGCNVGSMVDHLGRFYCSMCSTVLQFPCFRFVCHTSLIKLSQRHLSRFPKKVKFNNTAISHSW